MTKAELVDYVIRDITSTYSIPFSPPTAEIERIIDVESRYLYREYRDALQEGFYTVDPKYFQTQAWKNTRTIQFPDCVMGVKLCIELTGGSRIFGINDPDMSFQRMASSDLFLTPMSSDTITYRTIQWSFWDLAKTFNLIDINHTWNINTHRLVVLGRDPQNALYIKSLNKIPDEDLYEDSNVIRWITAKSKVSLARILGTFAYSLLGNVTINYESIKQEGLDDITELKAKFLSDSPSDWFMMIS